MKLTSKSRTIVFIHGLFLNGKSWSEWISFFEKQGFTTHAPSYLGHDGEPATLREKAPDHLGQLTFSDILHQFETLIKSLPEKPILIGHSMGGLIAQKLVEKDLATAAVIISSAPPRGVITTKFSFVKSNFGLLNPLKGNSIHYPTKKWFHYAFTNTLPKEGANQIYDRYVVPESRNIPSETLGKAGKIDFKKPHVPLLFISGEKDHIIPASLNATNFNRYKDSSSIREHKIFKGKDHFIIGLENGKDVASYILHWLE